MILTPIIDFCNGKLPKEGKKLLLSQPPQVSVITNVELFVSKAISEPEEGLLKKFIALSKVYPVTADLIDTVIQIRREYRLKCRTLLLLQQQSKTTLRSLHAIPLILKTLRDYT